MFDYLRDDIKKRKKFKNDYNISIDEYYDGLDIPVFSYYILKTYVKLMIDVYKEELSVETDNENRVLFENRIKFLQDIDKIFSNSNEEFILFSENNFGEETMGKLRSITIDLCYLNYDLTCDIRSLCDFCEIENILPSVVLSVCPYEKALDMLLSDVETFTRYIKEPYKEKVAQKLSIMAKERGIEYKSYELCEMFKEKENPEKKNSESSEGVTAQWAVT